MSLKEDYRQNINEDLLIAKIAAGDREALSTLYSMLNRPIFAYALSVLKNKEEAEDVMQDTFLKIKAAAHLYEAKGKPQAWIFTIVSNLCRMKLRQRGKLIDGPIEENDQLFIFEPIGDPALKATLEAAFKVLNDDERKIIILHAVSDLSFRQIADIIKMPLATILSKYYRSLKKLKKELEGKL